MDFGDVTFQALALSFTAGVFSFLSPCLLPLVPGYIGHLAGGIGADAASGTTHAVRRTLSFVLGFTIVFVLMGASASALGSFLNRNAEWFQLVGGIFIIALGLFLVFEDRLPPSLLARVGFNQQTGGGLSSHSQAVAFGATFGFAWSPCIGPPLAFALGLAAGTDGSPAAGAFLLFVFAMGIGLPFLLMAWAADAFWDKLGWVRRNMKTIRITGGVILILFGLVMATGLLGDLSDALSKITIIEIEGITV